MSAIAALFTATAPASASAPRLHYILADCQHLHYRPASLVISCAYQPFTVTGIHWSGWNRSIAYGTGTAHVKACSSSFCPPKRGTFAVDLEVIVGAFCRPGEPTYLGVLLYLPGTRAPAPFADEHMAPLRKSGCGTLERR